MADLKTIQQEFMRLLLEGDNSLAEHIQSQSPVATDIRLGIYQNAYRLRLKESMETDHEILGLYLGDELFDQMANQYTRQYPSDNPSLRHFCRHLPTFLQQTAPFNEHPQLAELAAFERLLLDAFDAPEAEPLGVEVLAQITPENWPGMTLRFRPCVQRLTTHYNSVESWQQLKQNTAPPEPIQLAVPAVWLLWRNHERLTEFRSLAPDEAIMLELALNGCDFAQMCEALLEWHEADMVAQRALGILQQWLNQGLIAQLK